MLRAQVLQICTSVGVLFHKNQFVERFVVNPDGAFCRSAHEAADIVIIVIVGEFYQTRARESINVHEVEWLRL